MTRSLISYTQAIERACQVIVNRPNLGTLTSSSDHMTYVHAWANGHYPPTPREQIAVEASIYIAGSHLVSKSLSLKKVKLAIKTIASVEHDYSVTDALANILLKVKIDKVVFRSEISHALGRTLIASTQSYCYKLRNSPLPNSCEERRRIFKKWFDFPLAIEVQIVARLLYRIDPILFAKIVYKEENPIHIFQLLTAIPLTAALEIATKASNKLLREMALIWVTLDSSIPVMSSVVTECLQVALNDEEEWCDRIKTFLSWPLYPGHQNLMTPFGQVIAKASKGQRKFALSEIPKDLPSLEARKRFTLLLEGFQIQASESEFEGFCSDCFLSWTKWLFEDTDSPIYPPVSWLEVAAEQHIALNMSAADQRRSVKTIRKDAELDDMKNYSNSLKRSAAHYRNLAAYQPYARVKSKKNKPLENNILPIDLTLMNSKDLEYFHLRYDYSTASNSWKRNVNYSS